MGLFLIGILVCPLGELQEIYLYPSAFIGSTGGEIPLLFLNSEINADWGLVLTEIPKMIEVCRRSRLISE